LKSKNESANKVSVTEVEDAFAFVASNNHDNTKMFKWIVDLDATQRMTFH